MAWNEFSPAEESQVAKIVSRHCWSFFNAAGIIHHEFVPEGTTVKSHYYLGVM
jgi:hypothetical protein